MHDFTKAITAFPGNEVKRYFRYEDKQVWLTPFSYSTEREKTGGFNDEDHFLLNSRTKVSADSYFEMARKWAPDFVVTPCEQVTHTSGKKKRRRSLKTAAKHAVRMAKELKEGQPVIASVMLGDEHGLDTFEMRHYMNAIDGVEGFDGYMVYGTDVLQAPQAFQDMKDFFEKTESMRLRALHGTGSPLEIINGIMSGIDLFESDYPLSLA
jgi:tRNA-guanine family transglycosylase